MCSFTLHPFIICRKDREKVIARQEFVDELSLWNDTQDAQTSILLPSKKLFSQARHLAIVGNIRILLESSYSIVSKFAKKVFRLFSLNKQKHNTT